MGLCTSRKSRSTTKTISDSAAFQSSYTILDKIGEGGFGKVYSAIHHLTSTTVVVKKIKKRDVYNTDTLDSTVVPREVKIMARLSHPNIIILHDFFTLDRSYLLILETLPIDLFDYMRRFIYLANETCKTIFQQLLPALDYLHTEIGVAHLDIKPENILYCPSTSRIKLIDFGAADWITDSPLISFEGTRLYASPDILLRRKYNPVDADLWALGVTLYQMLMGHMPFYCDEDYYTQLRFTRPDLDILAQHIISLLLCRQSDLRPKTVKDVINTPWMKF